MINAKARINKLPKSTPNIPPASENNVPSAGESVTQVAFDQKMQIINARLDTSNVLLIGVVVVLAICFITLMYGYFQFAGTSFNDYSSKVKELNDDRYTNLNSRLNNIESRSISTSTK